MKQKTKFIIDRVNKTKNLKKKKHEESKRSILRGIKTQVNIIYKMEKSYNH
jgi:hypothetical protein